MQRDLRLLLPRRIRELPADLAAVISLVLLTDLAVLVPGVNQTPLRVVLGLPLVLFLPGYALIAALFPEHGAPPTAADADPDLDLDAMNRIRDRGIDGIERVALSFGLSIAVVPLIGLVLNFTPWGIRLLPILVSVSGFTLVMTAVAAERRRDLPAEERFRVPYRDWVAAGKREVFEPETRTDAALNVLLVVSLVLAVSSVVFAVTVPPDGERFTEFYLLTEDDAGELVAAEYPTEFVAGEGQPVVIGIGNQEHDPRDYEIVILLQNVSFANNETVIYEQTELDRLRVSLGHNETWTTSYMVRPPMTGDRLRLLFLLYIDDPPPDPTVANSYRDTHLWINVTAAS